MKSREKPSTIEVAGIAIRIQGQHWRYQGVGEEAEAVEFMICPAYCGMMKVLGSRTVRSSALTSKTISCTPASAASYGTRTLTATDSSPAAGSSASVEPTAV